MSWGAAVVGEVAVAVIGAPRYVGEYAPSSRRRASSLRAPPAGVGLAVVGDVASSLVVNVASSSEICGRGVDRFECVSRAVCCCDASWLRPEEPAAAAATNPIFDLDELRLGVVGREIQMPSTSTPVWMARTPKGMSLLVRCLRAAAADRAVGDDDMPTLRISVRRARFSSSMTSWRRTWRLVRQSLKRPMRKTMTMAQARTWKGRR